MYGENGYGNSNFSTDTPKKGFAAKRRARYSSIYGDLEY